MRTEMVFLLGQANYKIIPYHLTACFNGMEITFETR